jgi:hypothetical protein
MAFFDIYPHDTNTHTSSHILTHKDRRSIRYRLFVTKSILRISMHHISISSFGILHHKKFLLCQLALEHRSKGGQPTHNIRYFVISNNAYTFSFAVTSISSSSIRAFESARKGWTGLGSGYHCKALHRGTEQLFCRRESIGRRLDNTHMFYILALKWSFSVVSDSLI